MQKKELTCRNKNKSNQASHLGASDIFSDPILQPASIARAHYAKHYTHPRHGEEPLQKPTIYGTPTGVALMRPPKVVDLLLPQLRAFTFFALTVV